jgi:hypothetical protein
MNRCGLDLKFTGVLVKKFNGIFFLLLLLFPPLSTKLLAEKPQFWGTVLIPIGKCRDIQFSFWQQYRFALSSFKLVDDRYSLYVKKSIYNWLDGEVHYTLINSRNADETPFHMSRRWELELNPHFDLAKNVEVKFRNRYEWIHRDDHPKEVQRFRQRHQLVWKTNWDKLWKTNWDRLFCFFWAFSLKSLSIHNEVFYNVTDNRVDEYRFVPLELGFGFGEKHKHTVKGYGMIRWRKPASFWDPQYIWGLTLEW